MKVFPLRPMLYGSNAVKAIEILKHTHTKKKIYIYVNISTITLKSLGNKLFIIDINYIYKHKYLHKKNYHT